MKKIGILGGTFNPPHIGHLIIANEVLDALELDEIRFMPNHVPPHKEKSEEVTDMDRLAMLENAIAGNPSFYIEGIEIERKGTSYTYDTIKLLKELEPANEFYFIIGADMIEYLPNWHRIDELVHMVNFVGVKRPGYNENTVYPITMVKVPQMFISSSMIRRKLRTGKTVKYLIADPVVKYIKGNGLYES
ncbi:nicotinate-nucleotide adenylyltransferase [Peribacillus castrilensis]|jgi:nicotinate-nucleotide adenylyltransferase|uniref:Probable nicotinate-nucleotide adenylyltransferase n=2 Tax=Peribacillus TaxID=2675229 RepID=A0AAJ1QPN0_9BACI|nr:MULTISPECIES: nicotinate-nucleotide adenylyltransferase [Bacillaceae]MCD1161200.1 nicotinate-nucleotide adenylyltransferase [Peribacillus castrilensis]MCP1092580.1 nicotinate-nucleotide adenylyltransferase [Bacillaceae bacterium OS4b]QYF85004.1 nicotinate-nucleotide adenylyltransferase [Brevibacterium sp. PAMC21349]MBD8587848.1 nicotinate-nucleotide adenylyltransferase [Peribacillus simplex]MCF7623574.1 nicotinate-nucleotide adenylyltransferase [Peribacillus frigoritolerans]